MEVTFSGKYAVSSETFGISFEAHLDGHRINCNVSQEALQDVDPDNAAGDVEQQFLANRSKLEDLAERKIRAALPTRINIDSADVRP